jgi:nucleoside-diphosphate-sugar epimerase
MRILVSGATGYIGGNLVRWLISNKHEVSILARTNSIIPKIQFPGKGIKTYVYDGSLKSIVNALEDANPFIVCHLASLFLSQHQPEDISRLIESNLNFPTQILEAMSLIGVSNFINTGTSWQHYQNEEYNPVNLYAATKQSFESLSQYYINAKAINVITLSLFDTYGPGDRRQKLFTLLRNCIHNGTSLKMSPGLQKLDLVYIDDVMRAYQNTIDNFPSLSKTTYGISSGKTIELNKLVEMYARITNREIKIHWGGLPYREREVMTPWENFQKLPNWAPTVDLSEGIVMMEKDPTINGLCSTKNRQE